MLKILMCEDEPAIARNLAELLRSAGYDPRPYGTAAEAAKAVESESFDLYLLDVTLPDGSGYALCTALRHLRQAPVIFLTASGDEMSVVTGLELGADDYITKPFRPLELLTRIKTVLRRSGKTEQVFSRGDVEVDLLKGTATKAGRDVFLTALEYRLLLIFINNRGATLPRSRLLSEIWDAGGEFVNDNTLTVYIKRLRDKLEDNPAEPELIKTVRGMGYRIE